MTAKPLILLTNDDGISAPGIRHLWEALAEMADVWIVAPAMEKSGAGLSITINTPLQIQASPWDKQTPAWKING
ncbi:MAG: 5'/3'-nucleotidase SurE, partial [Chlamydiales bacterium]|nr:5'/3'-nucleotidase SurE [Chlamydiales bacterium]